MRKVSLVTLNRLLVGVALLLVLKVAVGVVVGYRHYVPPDFSSDFLLGREAYFFGPYCWAFYAHLIAGPTSLIVGTILTSDRFRRWAPAWHRRLGRIQVGCVLLVIVPSGLWMARYAMTGAVAAFGLASLAVVTAICCAAGWRAAMARRFDEHRRWMWRTYLLLCSAVVIRMLGGLATVFEADADWVYPASVWVSWVAPLIAFETRRLVDAPPAPIAARS
jgi:uncharacterized membrane protein